MAADQEYQVAAFHLRLGDERCETGGGERVAGRVKKDLAGAGVLRPEVCAVGLDLAHFGGGVARGSGYEIFRDGVGGGVFGASDVVKKNLHSGGISTFLALRQRRSSP